MMARSSHLTSWCEPKRAAKGVLQESSIASEPARKPAVSSAAREPCSRSPGKICLLPSASSTCTAAAAGRQTRAFLTAELKHAAHLGVWEAPRGLCCYELARGIEQATLRLSQLPEVVKVSLVHLLLELLCPLLLALLAEHLHACQSAGSEQQELCLTCLKEPDGALLLMLQHDEQPRWPGCGRAGCSEPGERHERHGNRE